MASTPFVYPAAIDDCLEVLEAGTSPYTSLDGIYAMLTRSSTTCDTETGKQTLDLFSALDEYTSSNYARVGPLGSVAVTYTSGVVKLDMADPVFSSLDLSGDGPAFILLYVQKASAADDGDRVPLLLDALSETPDGSDYTYSIPSGGLVLIDTRTG